MSSYTARTFKTAAVWFGILALAVIVEVAVHHH